MSFLPLFVALALLMADAVIEVGFIGSMVGYLHQAHKDVPFYINGPNGQYALYPKPAHPITNQGHTSNGAAGTAFVLVGVLGYIAAWRQRKRQQEKTAYGPSKIFLAWTILTVLSSLLTISALIYTFVVTHQTRNQVIDQAVAAANSGIAYPDLSWTPENWYRQVLTLSFVNPSEMSDIRFHLTLMTGWRWNLIPLLVFGLVVCVLAFLHLLQARRATRSVDRGSGDYAGKYRF